MFSSSCTLRAAFEEHRDSHAPILKRYCKYISQVQDEGSHWERGRPYLLYIRVAWCLCVFVLRCVCLHLFHCISLPSLDCGSVFVCVLECACISVCQCSGWAFERIHIYLCLFSLIRRKDYQTLRARTLNRERVQRVPLHLRLLCALRFHF